MMKDMCSPIELLPFQGVVSPNYTSTQGDALGYVITALSGHSVHNVFLGRSVITDPSVLFTCYEQRCGLKGHQHSSLWHRSVYGDAAGNIRPERAKALLFPL